MEMLQPKIQIQLDNLFNMIPNLPWFNLKISWFYSGMEMIHIQ